MPAEAFDPKPLKRLLEDCGSAPGPDSAKQAYNYAWKLWFAALKADEESLAIKELEWSFLFFAAATEIFESLGLPMESGKGRIGHALIGGLLNHEGVSCDSNRKAVEWLSPLAADTANRDHEEACGWLVKALRGIAEGGESDRERMDACRRGLLLLRRITARRGSDEGWLRYRALFYRAAGRCEARRRPKTRRSLQRAEENLQKSLACFRKLTTKKAMAKGSVSKAMRELSRVFRARAAFLQPTQPKATACLLERAEELLREGMAMAKEIDRLSQWDNYHLAKVLRDRGDLKGAMSECLKAVERMESGRECFSEDDNRIGYLKDKLSIYDLGIYLAHMLGKADLGFELSQRCKARVFMERLQGRLKSKDAPIQGVAELRARLGDGDLLVDYHMGHHALSIFAVSKQGITEKRIWINRDTITTRVGQLKGFMRQAQTDKNLKVCDWALKRLAQDLIEPLAAEIGAASCLHVVPSGPLIEVPFAALPMPDGTRLLERLPVSYLPHASMLLAHACVKPTRRSLLALANPTGGLAQAEMEAEEIAKVFPGAKLFVGAEANKKALELCGNCGLLHIACHGEFLPDDALGSHLILAPGHGHNGLLRVDEILALPLADLDLAFLSCCKTGQGRHKGCDEVESVHRAFLMAGARSVVVTLWDIEDAVAKQLVTAFYRHLADGKPKAEALRQAQLTVLKVHPHPYHWAAFKLVGSAV